jgi:hypothetical protein
MKYKIEKTLLEYKIEEVAITLSDHGKCREDIRYIVSYKWYWWQSYRYILEPQTKVPELFETIDAAKEAISNL